MKKSFLNIKKLALFSCVFTLVSCSDWFQGKIPMDTETSRTSLSGLLVPAVKITSLAVPSQIFASQGLYAGEIRVSWSEVEGATSYTVQRAIVSQNADGSYSLPTSHSEYEDLDWVTLRDLYYSSNYTDTILSNPTATAQEYSYRYYYRIMANNIAKGLESDFSNPYIIQEDRDNDGNLIGNTESYIADLEGLGYLFAPCSSLDATKGKSENSIELTWNATDGAVGYWIYRDTREDFTSAARLVDIKGNVTHYTMSVNNADDKGKEFYFKVEAQNSLGNYSAQSSIAMGYALQAGAPVAPSGLKVVDGLGTETEKITLSWEALESTANQEITYALYRTSSVDSVFTCIKKDIPANETSYDDKNNLKPGLYYYYYIQAVGYELSGGERTGNVLKSAFSDTGIETKNPAVGFILSAPQTLEALDSTQDTSSKIKLVWTPAIGTNLSSLSESLSDISFTYNVYYSDTESGVFELLEAGITGESYEGGYLSYEVSKKNYYKMTTLNSLTKESAFSSAAAPQPDAPNAVNASKTKNLSSYGSAIWQPNENEVYPVEITWKAPSSEPVPYGYYLYRSTKKDSAFRKVTENLLNADSGNYHSSRGVFYFIDSNTSAKSGMFYYYKVVSVNSLGQGKKGNDPANDSTRSSWGYGALTLNQWFREYNKEIASSQAKLTLMHKSKDTDKLGSETINADVPVNGKLGTLSYSANLDGLGARITMPYTEYADHYINDDKTLGVAFILNGPTNTSSNMSANGSMDGTVQCYHYADYNGLFQGMYPGKAIYNNLQIKSGAAGGGYYLVTTYELDRSSSTTGTVVIPEGQVSWLVGEEIRN